MDAEKIILPEKKRLVLLSNSARRRELIKRIFFNPIKIVTPERELNEKEIKELSPAEFVKKNALIKLFSGEAKIEEEEVAIAADTIVYYKKTIIGKPENYNEAVEILETLNNQIHYVYTGFTIYEKSKRILIVDNDVSKVKFKKYDKKFIEEYLNSFNYLDKAGAYALQEDKLNIVEYYEGSRENIIGLPIQKIIEAFKKIY